MNNLRNLVQESRQLTNHILPTGLTPLDRGLEQIELQTKRLLKRTSDVKKMDHRTQYLLASRGIDTEQVLEHLDVSLGLTFEPLQGISDTDIEGFLRNEHENLVSLAIEESRNQAILDFEQGFEDALRRDWDKQKQRLMESFGHFAFQDTVMDQTNGISGLVSAGGISQHPRLARYAQVVKEINDARKLHQEPFNVASAFQKASEQTSTDKQQNFITSSWSLLAKMLGVQKENQITPGQFSSIYRQSIKQDSSEQVTRFRTRLVQGGREWLEETFRQMVTQYVREHHYEIGGLPSVHTEVDAYLKIKYYRNGRWTLAWLDQSIGRVPFWAHVYLLVRMGLLKEALDYIQKYSGDLAQSRDTNFLSYFRAWIHSPDGRLPKALRDSLFGEWNARIRDYVVNAKTTPKGDVFKYALYKIIGRCDLNVKAIRNSDVIQTTDDYLWVHTMLISEDTYATDTSFEQYSLADFSTSMQKFGKSYFQKTDVWFMVLLLCGEFEKAVNELFNEPYFTVDAIHFAVAMAYFGVLNVPDNPKEIPISNTLLSCTKVRHGTKEYEVYSFHFARMVSQLVKEWVRTDPVEMMHYAYLIGLFGKPLSGSIPQTASKVEWEHGREYTRFVLALIKDILSQTGKTAELMGHMRADGKGRVGGPVEQYRTLIHLDTEQEFLDRIILSAAEQCDREGRIKDALELYNLSCQPNKVLELLNRQIGEMVLAHSVPATPSAKPDGSVFAYQDPVETATNVLTYYMSRSQEAALLNPQTVYTCRTLVTLANFRKAASLGQLEHSLELFYSLDIVPSSNEMNLLQKKAQSFTSLDESICRVLPNTLVSVATVLSQLYQQIAQSRLPERESRLNNLKQRIKAILSFCGLVQYQIPGEIFAKINRLDVMMG